MHRLIKGENLEVLQNMVEEGLTFDCIYIDPPYNTRLNMGYTDSFGKKYDHSIWLKFMEERLILAEKLMSEDAVIYVSIDEREYAYLKILMDGIFKESNYITTFNWINSINNLEEIEEGNIRLTGGNSGEFKNTYEFIIAYRKGSFKLDRLPPEEEFVYTRLTKRGCMNQTLILPKDTRCELCEGRFSGTLGGKSEPIILLDDMVIKNYRLVNDVRIKADMANPKIVKRYIEDPTNCFDNSGQKIEELFIKKSGIPCLKKANKGKIVSNTLSGYGDTKRWKRELESLIGKTFMYPKPYLLIADLIRLHPNKNCKVLDFFAGSGSTIEAVIYLNNEGGCREATAVTNNENQIFDSVLVPRVQALNKKYEFQYKIEEG